MTHADPIYLDHNATTPVLPAVVEAMLPYLREHFGNPSSGHVYGARSRAAVAHARAQVAALLGCDDDEIVFTSGGTEANNLAIRGVVDAVADRRGVVTTMIEHPATLRPCEWLERRGYRVAASTGSACHDGDAAASAVILAMGVSPVDALGSVRLTLGRSTTAEDIARASAALFSAWRASRP